MADFSNLQGYNVKDAYARERIEALESGLDTPYIFGAKGDGIADDTSAFIEMLNSGKTMFLIPNGTFNVDMQRIPITTNVSFLCNKNAKFTTTDALNYFRGYSENALVLNNLMRGEPEQFNVVFYSNYNQDTEETDIENNVTIVSDVLNENDKNMHWGLLSIMNDGTNRANDNVAIYGQANSKKDGKTWAACFEIRDENEEPQAGKVGVEVTCVGNGNDSNEARHGINIALHPFPESTGCRYESGLLINANQETVPCYYNNAIKIENCKMQNAILIKNSDAVYGLNCVFSNIGHILVGKVGQGILIGNFNLKVVDDSTFEVNYQGTRLFGITTSQIELNRKPVLTNQDVVIDETGTKLKLNINGNDYYVPLTEV